MGCFSFARLGKGNITQSTEDDIAAVILRVWIESVDYVSLGLYNDGYCE